MIVKIGENNLLHYVFLFKYTHKATPASCHIHTRTHTHTPHTHTHTGTDLQTVDFSPPGILHPTVDIHFRVYTGTDLQPWTSFFSRNFTPNRGHIHFRVFVDHHVTVCVCVCVCVCVSSNYLAMDYPPTPT